MRNFLWNGPDHSRGIAKVAWKDIACPLHEGGLRIKRIGEWNEAAMSKHLWHLTQPTPPSHWAKWARANLIRGRSLWDFPIPNDCPWTWRKLLSLRDKFRPFIRSSVGNGFQTFLWFDYWLPMGPIVPNMGDNMIFESGLPRNAIVSTLIRNSQWRWP